MSAKPPPAEMLALFDANPGKYKDVPEGDGYNSTPKIIHSLALAPQIANPVAQTNVLENDPLLIQDLYNVLDNSELASMGMEGWTAVSLAIARNDREEVKRLANVALQKTWIAQAKYDAIVAHIDSTILDPDWQATVNGLNDLRANWPNEEPGIHFKYVHETVLGRS